MSWEEFKRQGKIIEENFAKNLDNPVWATREEDMFEHWDLKGSLEGKLLKFDVKGMKKKNRSDSKFQDDIAWVEGTNVRGKGVYQIYQREGRQDKITMVPFEDIEKINNVKRINKNAETSI